MLPVAHALPGFLFEGDGITALIRPTDAMWDELVFRDSNGEISAEVSVFFQDRVWWEQVSVPATLSLRYKDEAGHPQVLSRSLTTDALVPVRVSFPGDVVSTGDTFDMWLTIPLALGGEAVSYHNTVKNFLIRHNRHNDADVIDGVPMPGTVSAY